MGNLPKNSFSSSWFKYICRSSRFLNDHFPREVHFLFRCTKEIMSKKLWAYSKLYPSNCILHMAKPGLVVTSFLRQTYMYCSMKNEKYIKVCQISNAVNKLMKLIASIFIFTLDFYYPIRKLSFPKWDNFIISKWYQSLDNKNVFSVCSLRI